VVFLGAMGRGRSYGQTSELLGRRLPGILQCGLWPSLERLADAPTAALITDIGNDILYEVPVERLVSWVGQCLDRLVELEAHTILTQLPVENLKNLSPQRFLFYRRLFVPKCQLDQAEISARVVEVNEQVTRMARERGMPVVSQDASWYGLDPIHIHLRAWPRAWRTILSPWINGEPPTSTLAKISPARALQCALFFPENAAYFGIPRRVRQPCARLCDGTTVAIY